MQTIWIARHGNRLDFVNPQWLLTADRPYDTPLSEDGFEQATALGKRLKDAGIVRIIASPFLRTVQTAHQAAEVLDVPIWLEVGLSEFLHPFTLSESPQLIPIDELRQQFPRIDPSYVSRGFAKYPEDNRALDKRAGDIIQKLTAEFPEPTLLISHQSTIQAMVEGLVPKPPKIPASICSLTRLDRQGTGWTIGLNSDTSHLLGINSKHRASQNFRKAFRFTGRIWMSLVRRFGRKQA